MTVAMASGSPLSRRAKKLLILLVAQLEEIESARVRRALASAAADLPLAHVSAIGGGDLESPVFDDAERALLAYARRFLEGPGVESRYYEAAERHYSVRQLFEATLTLGLYQSMARGAEGADAAAGGE